MNGSSRSRKRKRKQSGTVGPGLQPPPSPSQPLSLALCFPTKHNLVWFSLLFPLVSSDAQSIPHGSIIAWVLIYLFVVLSYLPTPGKLHRSKVQAQAPTTLLASIVWPQLFEFFRPEETHEDPLLQSEGRGGLFVNLVWSCWAQLGALPSCPFDPWLLSLCTSMAAVISPSPPAIAGPQPTWVPYEPTRDCSQGLCSMYCPQWCYFVFPPPPPAFDIAGPGGDDDSSGPTFSPLVIAIIGVLASAFLLVSYYTIISKYCGTFSSLWNWLFGAGRGGGGVGGGGHGDRDGHGGSQSQEPWSAVLPDGLDETLINKITVCKYKRGDGFVDSTDCSVCLGEFRDGESLRLLPKCSHAFHLPCIDTWLKSHSNCPLCRCNIAFVTVGVVSPEPERRVPREERRDSQQLVLTIEDYSEQTREEPQNQNAANGNGVDGQEAPKDRPGRSEEASSIVEIKEDGAPPVRASSSLSDTYREGRMSIADVLHASLEDELIMARESGLVAGSSGSSRRCHGENSKDSGGRSGRALPDAANSMPSKKLPAAGRSCFSSRNGRGKDSVLPIS